MKFGSALLFTAVVLSAPAWAYLTPMNDSGGGGGVDAVAAVGSSPAAAGASISGTTLTLQPADATHPGVVTTGAQTYTGDKTIEGRIVVNPPAGDGYAMKLGPLYVSVFSTSSAYFANGASFDITGWHNYLGTGVGVIELSGDGNTRFFNQDSLSAPPNDFSPALQMVIKPTGVVQMNSYGAGAATFDGSGNISSASDERLKTAIKPFKEGLAAISKIDPIRYHWNAESGMETLHEYVGFSAQNVQSALPEGVGRSSKGYLSLQDRALLAAVVNALKELDEKIQRLEQKK